VKRFSQEVDQEFEIAGEVFRWMFPYWEDIAEVFDRDADEDEAELSQDGKAVTITIRSTIEDYIKRIELFIDPDFNDGRTRWRELAKRRKNPIPHAQYHELYRWLLEVTSNPYPTTPSSPSEDGQPSTALTSTAGSS
jgi:hypothetical protein